MALDNEGKKGKFHTIERGEQADDIDELFDDVYKRLKGLDVLTTKGDIIVYDGKNYVRLAKGDEGQVLTSRGTAALGIQWEDPADGGDGSTGAGTMRYWFNGLPYGAL